MFIEKLVDIQISNGTRFKTTKNKSINTHQSTIDYLMHLYNSVLCEKYINKTEVESVQLGYTYIADMDKCPQDKCCLDRCRGDICHLLFMFPGPFV